MYEHVYMELDNVIIIICLPQWEKGENVCV